MWCLLVAGLLLVMEKAKGTVADKTFLTLFVFKTIMGMEDCHFQLSSVIKIIHVDRFLEIYRRRLSDHVFGCREG